MKKNILLIFFLFSQIVFCQEDSRMSKSRLIKEAQEQLNKGIAPNDVVLINKSQTMAEADEIEEIKVQLKKMENARALKLKLIAEAKEDSIAEATNPTLHKIREIARAKLVQQDLEKKEQIAQNAKEFYFDGYTPLDTLIAKQLKMGILPCDIKITCSSENVNMVDENLKAFCRGLKLGQDVPGYILELEEYQQQLINNHRREEFSIQLKIEQDSKTTLECGDLLKQLESLYKLRSSIALQLVNLRYSITSDFNNLKDEDIQLLILNYRKMILSHRSDYTSLSNEDYVGIQKMNWDEDKYYASKNLKQSKSTNNASLKYESIWSMYTDKKLSVMPKFNIEEAESFSTFVYNNTLQTITITTSSPDGDDKKVIKINNTDKVGNETNYFGTDDYSKIIVSINNQTKWIEITNTTNGHSSYEYHKIN